MIDWTPADLASKTKSVADRPEYPSVKKLAASFARASFQSAFLSACWRAERDGNRMGLCMKWLTFRLKLPEDYTIVATMSIQTNIPFQPVNPLVVRI